MFSKLNKKTIIIGIILVVLLVIALVLSIWNRSHNQATRINNPNEDKVLLPHLTKDNLSLYYFSQKNNALIKWNLTKNSTQDWLKFDFPDTDNIIYAPNLETALVHTTNSQNAVDAHTWLINLDPPKIVSKLNDNVLTADFSPDSQKIAYHYFDWDNNINYLAISDPNGTNEQKLTDIESEAINLVWADQKNILYYTLPFESSTVDLKLISLENKKSETLADSYFIDNAKLIPEEKKILINLSTEENKPGKLTILDPFSKTFDTLNSTAQVNQVAFAPGNLIYAAYNNSTNDLKSDSFQIINLINQQINGLKVKSKYTLHGQTLMVTSDNKTLYFTSDDILYKLSL